MLNNANIVTTGTLRSKNILYKMELLRCQMISDNLTLKPTSNYN